MWAINAFRYKSSYGIVLKKNNGVRMDTETADLFPVPNPPDSI
jgi:hypothetical protein